jgi:hypothetical protein
MRYPLSAGETVAMWDIEVQPSYENPLAYKAL